jgi:hypothetical protein
LPKSPVGEAAACTRANRAELSRYQEVPYLAVDNNAVESALRPVAVGRENWLQPGSEVAIRRSC